MENKAHKTAQKIADTFNTRLSTFAANDARYATYAEDIEVSYLVVSEVFLASIQGSSLFCATHKDMQSALDELLAVVTAAVA